MGEFLQVETFEMFCKGVNGDLVEIKQGIRDLNTKLDDHMKNEAACRREDIREALKGTTSKGYAIAVAVLSVLFTGSVGTIITIVVARH